MVSAGRLVIFVFKRVLTYLVVCTDLVAVFTLKGVTDKKYRFFSKIQNIQSLIEEDI